MTGTRWVCPEQDYDCSQFDAFCLCLEIGSGPGNNQSHAYGTLCNWLLELTVKLIRPDLPAASAADVSFVQAQPAKAGKVLADGTGSSCRLAVEQRFPYFMSRVRRARIWSDNDGALFQRLHVAAADCMEEIAALCHQR